MFCICSSTSVFFVEQPSVAVRSSLCECSFDIFEFANEICNLEIANGDILVSCDVSSLFTNVHFD